MFIQKILMLMIASVLVSCVQTETSDTTEPVPSKTPSALVEGYPDPVDPAWIRKKERPAPIPPKVIVNGENGTLIYTCRATHCDILRDAIEGFISPEGAIQSIPSLNKLIIKDTTEFIFGLLKMVESLDQPYPQLLIEARIVEITLENDEQFEISHIFRNVEGGGARFVQDSDTTLKTPGSATGEEGARFTLRSITGDYELDTFLRYLAAKSKARILSSPNLIVGVGYQANLNTGEEIPIQSVTFSGGVSNTTTTFKNVGIKLRVTPTQITSDSAQLEISPEVSTVVRFTDPGPSGVSNPIVAVRNVRTSLTVKDGEIITIGGLLRNEDRYAERKVPGIGDLPLVGELFKSKRKEKVKTALVFFLHVNILQQSTPDSILFHKPGTGMKKLDEEVKNLLAPEDLTIPKFVEEQINDLKKSSTSTPEPSPEKKTTFNNATPPSSTTFAPIEPVIIDVTPPKKEEPPEPVKETEPEKKEENATTPEKKEENATTPEKKEENATTPEKKEEKVEEKSSSSTETEKESSETKEPETPSEEKKE